MTTNLSAAAEFGIDEAACFPMWDWVGGRYSVWSAIGLVIALGFGWQAFSSLLEGARTLDEHTRYVSGFGGSELGCLVGIEALELSSSRETLANVEEIAEHMRHGLTDIQSRYPFMFDIRQVGVIAALGFDDPLGGMKMAAALYQEGLWAMFAGYDRRYLQFKTGLLVDKAYCDEALEKVEGALKKVTAI